MFPQIWIVPVLKEETVLKLLLINVLQFFQTAQRYLNESLISISSCTWSVDGNQFHYSNTVCEILDNQRQVDIVYNDFYKI